jgi:hypothetical protein
MADRTTRLSIKVLVDAAKGAGDLNKLGDSAGGITDKFGKIAAGVAAFAGVTAFVKSAADAASNLEQSMGGIEAVFKSSASQVEEWGSQAASTLGLSQSAYQDLATLIGSQLKNAGTSMEDLAPKTDGLIRQGADLAAMYGGTTAEAVGALSSALKGERDPIEKYGISLNEASIQAEILALGLDTSTNAAQQTAKATATLSLITKQSADAAGAAAREFDSYASVQQRASAVWEDTMAQIGTALLPALSSLGSAFADLAPIIGAVLTPIAELLGWVLQLPGPILAAAAAVGAWKVFGGTITTALSSFSGAARGAGDGAYTFGQKLGGAVKMIGAFAAIAAIGMVISTIVGSFQDAAKAAEQWNTAVTDLGTQLMNVSDNSAGAVDKLVQAQIAGTDSFKAVTAAGVDYKTAMDAATGAGDLNAQQTDAVRAALEDLDPAMIVQFTQLQNMKSAALASAEAQKALDVANRAAADGTTEAAAAATISAEEQAKLAAEQQKAAETAAQQAVSTSAVSVALASVNAAANSAATAVQFFVLQMQTAAGMNVSMDQAAQLMNASLRDTAAAFKESADKGGINLDALVNWNAAALTSTDSGDQLYSSLMKMQTGYATSTVAAYENAGGAAAGQAAIDAAAGAADSAYAAFITMATGATGSSDAAIALAKNLGIVQGTNIDPKTFELIAEKDQADRSLAEIQGLNLDPKTVQVNAETNSAASAIESTAAGAPPATIETSAATQDAANQIAGVAGKAYKSTVDTNANVAPATSTINGFTGQARDTTIQVQANTGPAQGAITALVTQSRTLTITVAANTGPAESAISRVVNGSYTATINVTANTSAAQAAVAAIPRSVTVAPAPAPAPVAASFAARSLSAFTAPDNLAADAEVPLVVRDLVTGSGAGVHQDVPAPSINITVQGALDPDAVARQVDELIRRRERRSTTVFAR